MASFQTVVLTALKETEQSLVEYSTALDSRHLFVEAQSHAEREYVLAQARLSVGAIRVLELLLTEQTEVAASVAVANADLEVVRANQCFQGLGADGWTMSVLLVVRPH